MDQMKSHIDMVAASREKEDVSTKEGYLLQINEKHRVKNKWTRNWYVLRDGLFYCKSGRVPYQPAYVVFWLITKYVHSRRWTMTVYWISSCAPCEFLLLVLDQE